MQKTIDRCIWIFAGCATIGLIILYLMLTIGFAYYSFFSKG